MTLGNLGLTRPKRGRCPGHVRLLHLLYGFVALCLVNCAWLLLTPRSLPEQLRSGTVLHLPEVTAASPLAYAPHFNGVTRAVATKVAQKPDVGALHAGPPLRQAPGVLAANHSGAGVAVKPSRGSPHPPVVKTQAEGAAPLPEPLASLLRTLRSLPALLSQQRLASRGRISCGGTGVVAFKQWEEILRAGTHLRPLLPERSYPPAAIAHAVAATPCYWGTTHNAKCKGLWEREVRIQQWDKPRGGSNFTITPDGSTQRTCAVVGNGGRLRHEVHGKEIDARDVVIRFNQGKTQGFEKHVGTKSTFRLFNGPYVEAKQAGEICVAQMRDLALRAWVAAYQKHPGAVALVFDPEFLCHAWEWVDKQGEKPSSGLVGIIFALSMCSLVDVYGFEYGAYFNSSSQPHYYDWERPKPGREDVHPFAKESELYQLLQSAGLVMMH